MSGPSSFSTESLEKQAFGLMGRLHVMLRREIGRVTDIKYMGMNPEYCAHVLDVVRQVANPELQEISQRLEEIYFGAQGVHAHSGYRPVAIPNASVRNSLVSAEKPPPDEDGHHDHSGDIEPSYIGRLR